MKNPEDAVNEAMIHPISRVLVLLSGTWMIGSLHPIPETVYYLVRGSVELGTNSWWHHQAEWFDFRFIPVLGDMGGKTALVSGPISVFCFVCSALDRWHWAKATALSGISTFFMLTVDDWAPYGTGWIRLTLVHFAIMVLVITVIRPLRET